MVGLSVEILNQLMKDLLEFYQMMQPQGMEQ
jgi:hypothetical protein